MSAIIQSLRQALRGLKLGDLKILLENTAGQGTSLCWQFEEMKAILEGCRDLAIGVCIDTAHVFAAGHDIRSAEGLESALRLIDSTVGLDRVFVLHVNDSKTALGSRVDRHEHIGKGKIGAEAFGRILNHSLLAGRAFILETPIDKPGDDRRNAVGAVEARRARRKGNRHKRWYETEEKENKASGTKGTPRRCLILVKAAAKRRRSARRKSLIFEAEHARKVTLQNTIPSRSNPNGRRFGMSGARLTRRGW